jgi:hypothetical protein
VDQETKLLCILALNNLLDDTTVDYLLDEVLTSTQTHTYLHLQSFNTYIHTHSHTHTHTHTHTNELHRTFLASFLTCLIAFFRPCISMPFSPLPYCPPISSLPHYPPPLSSLPSHHFPTILLLSYHFLTILLSHHFLPILLSHYSLNILLSHCFLGYRRIGGSNFNDAGPSDRIPLRHPAQQINPISTWYASLKSLILLHHY